MAGILNDVFGAPVTIIPKAAQSAYEIQAVVRSEDLEVENGQGEIVMARVSTIQVQNDAAARLVPGDEVVTLRARYRIDRPVEPRSPAADRFHSFLLKDPV